MPLLQSENNNPKPTGRKWFHLAAIAFIFALSFLFYYNSLGNDFVYDDLYIVKTNPHIRSLGKHFDEKELKIVDGEYKEVRKSSLKKMGEFFTDYRHTAAASMEWTTVYRPLRQVSLSFDYLFAEKSEPECEGPETHRGFAGKKNLAQTCTEDGSTVVYADTASFHVMSIIYHAIAAVMVYFFLGLFVKNPVAMFAGAVIFAAHPVQGVSLMFISAGRDAMLQTIFFLAALFSIVRAWRTADENRRAFYHRLSLLFFGLALLSKISSIVLPVAGIALVWLVLSPAEKKDRFRGWTLAGSILVLSVPFLTMASFAAMGAGFLWGMIFGLLTLGAIVGGWMVVNRYNGRSLLGGAARLVDYGVILAGYYWVRQSALQQGLGQPTEYKWQGLEKMFSQMVAGLAHYLRVLFVPSGLTADHTGWRESVDLFGGGWFWMLLGVFVFIGILALSFFYARKVAFGLYLFLLGLLMVVNVIPVPQPVSEWSLYLPMAGIAILFALGIEKLIGLRFWAVKAEKQRPGRGVMKYAITAAIMLGLLIPWGHVVRGNNRAWKDGVSFWEDALAKLPYNYNAPLNVGIYYGKRYSATHEKADIDLAIKYLEKSVEINPKNASAFSNLGTAYSRIGNNDLAIKKYEEALKVDPNHKEALLNSAKLLMQSYDFKRAGKHYDRLIQIERFRARTGKTPDAQLLAICYSSLGKIALEQNRAAEAVELLNDTLRISPEQPDNVYLDLARAYQKLGQYKRAESLFLNLAEGYKKRRDKKSYAEVQFYRGFGYQFSEMPGGLKMAEEIYKEVLSIVPNYFPAHQNLGKMLADQKRFREAEKHFATVLKLDRKNPLSYANLVMTWLAIDQMNKDSGRRGEAVALLEKALQSESTQNVRLYKTLGQIYLEDSRWQDAARVYREMLAKIYGQLKANPNMRNDRQAMSNIRPEIARAEYILALLYARQKDRAGTLEHLRRAVENGVGDEKLFENENFDWLREDPEFRALVEKRR